MNYKSKISEANKRAYLSKIFVLGLLLLLLAGCAGEDGMENENNAELEKVYQGLEEQNIEWVKMVNQRGSLKEFYHSSAGLLFENGWYLTQDEIEDKLHVFNIKERIVLSVHEHDPTMIFEMGEYVLSDDSVLTYLTGFVMQNGIWLRHLDVMYERVANTVDTEVIDEIVLDRDEKWKELLLVKDVDRLVGELFWEDARYFNLVTGHQTSTYEELVEEYRWIELPNIQFSVKTLDYQIVSDNVIYTIGQYQGRTVGLYTLVLTKNEEGVWKNILDANY
jgi:hypothetical protein